MPKFWSSVVLCIFVIASWFFSKTILSLDMD